MIQSSMIQYWNLLRKTRAPTLRAFPALPHAVKIAIDRRIERRPLALVGCELVAADVVEQALERDVAIGMRADHRVEKQVLDAVEVGGAAQQQRTPAGATKLRRQRDVIEDAVDRFIRARVIV